MAQANKTESINLVARKERESPSLSNNEVILWSHAEWCKFYSGFAFFVLFLDIRHWQHVHMPQPLFL